MYAYHDRQSVAKAIKLRTLGYSYGEISQKLNIAKSTASLWLQGVQLNKNAKIRLQNRSITGLNNMIKTKKGIKNMIIKSLNEKSAKAISEITFTKEICKLLCSLLYWAEGAKATQSLSFINSDSKMITTFLDLLRKSFNLDENKFHALVHIHEYHNDQLTKEYWSKITHIPLSQFNRSFLKPHTKKRIKEGYMGCISIKYYDYRIALELRSVYNSLVGHLGA